MRPLALTCAALATLVAGSLMAAPPARAADITVTTTADEVVDDGACSLREAIMALNLGAPVDTCAGDLAGFDAISLPPGHYQLTIAGAGEDDAATGDLDIHRDVLIHGGIVDGSATGSLHETVIDGGGLDRVFDIHGGANVAGLSFMVISGGSAPGDDGGAIRRSGVAPLPDGSCPHMRLSLANVVVRDSTAERGGGIFVERCAQLDAVGTSVADNVAAGDGGGVAAAANAIVSFIGSTISGNAAGGAGGALWSEGPAGGGLFWTTVAHNTALTAGGLWMGASPTNSFALNSTILAHNSGASCFLATPSQSFNLHNLSTDAGCPQTAAANQPFTDPQLLPRDEIPLAYRLAPGSPAIDAGEPMSDCGGVGDQYGLGRPTDGDGDGIAVCDIGSYEAPGAPPTASPSPSPGSGGLPDTAVRSPSPGMPVTILRLLVPAALLLALVSRRRREPVR